MEPPTIATKGARARRRCRSACRPPSRAGSRRRQAGKRRGPRRNPGRGERCRRHRERRRHHRKRASWRSRDRSSSHACRNGRSRERGPCPARRRRQLSSLLAVGVGDKGNIETRELSELLGDRLKGELRLEAGALGTAEVAHENDTSVVLNEVVDGGQGSLMRVVSPTTPS